MKLVIQIPCYNEEKTLPVTLRDLPKSIPGISTIEIMVVDDGSTDGTVRVARQAGVPHVVSFTGHRGLAAAFSAGVERALALGADVLVNTDADNQYQGADVVKLVEPILAGRADLVIGCRPIADHPDFSLLKKKLQIWGSWIFGQAISTVVDDASSGFRGYSREALLRLNVYSRFSYCLETLVHANYENLKIECVPIRVNPKTRDSRLFSNIPEYLLKQGKTILTIFLIHRAHWFFNFVASTFFFLAIVLLVRYFILTWILGRPSSAFWPSIVISGALLAVAFQAFLLGIIASLLAAVRKLCEDVNYRLKSSGQKTGVE